MGIHVRQTSLLRGQLCGLPQDAPRPQVSIWKRVVKVPEENVVNFLEDLYEQNLPLAKQNIEHKKNQSNLAKKRKAEEDSQARSSAQAEAPSSSSAAAFLGPDPDAAPRAPAVPARTVSSAASSSGQPDARGRSTWSYNRDYYGMQREWSKYRGQWCRRPMDSLALVFSFSECGCRE